MTLALVLRDTLTGESARIEEEVLSTETANFYWLDGNGACDCERLRRIAEAHGRPDPNLPCGTGRVDITAATIDGVEQGGWV